jgi:hypothetical protein
MSQKDSQDSTGQGTSPDSEQKREMSRVGTGSASALERMKAEHALRHKRQHGHGGSSGGAGNGNTSN